MLNGLPGYHCTLTGEQFESLEKLQWRMSRSAEMRDLCQDAGKMLRFLRARSFDVDAAESMLQNDVASTCVTNAVLALECLAFDAATQAFLDGLVDLPSEALNEVYGGSKWQVP